jgi:non-specific serine/threonine protein kinase
MNGSIVRVAWSGAAGGEGERRAYDFLAAHTLAALPDAVVRWGEVWSLCERCAAGGDAPAAAALYARLTAFAAGDDGCAGVWSSAVAHHLGLLAAALARWDAAAAHFEEALRLCDGRGAGLDAARTQCAYARVLLARDRDDDASRAQRLLAELIASWHGLGVGGGVPASAARPPAARAASRSGAACRYVFRREGDYWTVAGDGRVARLRGLRGFEYVGELLRHPFQPIYVVDLAAAGCVGGPRLSAAQALEQGLRVSGDSGVAPRLDLQARSDYRTRWREVLAELEEAERDNDPGRSARLQREIDMLSAELAAAGPVASRRAGPSLKERARVNVRNCIAAALRAIRRHDEVVWRHLLNSIKTGTFCSYAPDRPVEWEM